MITFDDAAAQPDFDTGLGIPALQWYKLLGQSEASIQVTRDLFWPIRGQCGPIGYQ